MTTPFSLRVQLRALWFLSPLMWLPLVRGALQPGYQWNFFGLGGQGLGGHYPIMLAVFAATASLIYWAWRRPESRAVRFGLVAWFGAAAALLGVPAARGEGLIFQGDTLGIRVNLSWIAAATFIGLFILSLATALQRGVPRDRATRSHPAQPLNKVALGVAGVAAAVQVPCLLMGTLHGSASQVGVIATIVQALALITSLRPPRYGDDGVAGAENSWISRAACSDGRSSWLRRTASRIWPGSSPLARRATAR